MKFLKQLVISSSFMCITAQGYDALSVEKTKFDNNSVGCGILKGRLVYLEKTHDEIKSEMNGENGPRLEVLKIVAKRYAQVFQEDAGYLVTFSWDLGNKKMELEKFSVEYPGMIWTSDSGQFPEGFKMKILGNTLILKAHMSSFDYCLGNNSLTLKIPNEESGSDLVEEFAARWLPSGTL